VAGAVSCLAVDGRPLRFLQAEDLAALRAEAVRAKEEGIGALLVAGGPLGDPFVLLAGLSDAVPGLTLVARVVLGEDGRHPTLLAREATSLDLVDGGRTVLCFGPPFGSGLDEAIGICRAMWQEGAGTSEGPVYPVANAVNRPGPARAGSPLIALDLTEPGARDEAGGTAALADMVVVRDEAGDGAGWRLEPV
jgi:alkanesulfonate monooxygenase SsuD/methylene tetrahydromethanopterin reductase-like flavin-dependent oxidoreductase (luciferase family)